MNVNTAGQAMGDLQAQMGASGARPEHVMEGNKENGQSLAVRTSGANATPPEAKAAPKVDVKALDNGPKVDPKTNSYRKAVYAQTVRHNSTGGGTTLIREDR